MFLLLKRLSRSFLPSSGASEIKRKLKTPSTSSTERKRKLELPPQTTFETSKEKAIDLTTENGSWLSGLVRGLVRLFSLPNVEGQETEATAEALYSPHEIDEITQDKLIVLHGQIEDFATDLNKILVGQPELEQLHVTTARFVEQTEPDADLYKRCRATSSHWSLILRSCPGQIDIFLAPSNELFSGFESETDARLKATFRLDLKSPSKQWEIDSCPTDQNEEALLIKLLFKELVLKSAKTLAALNTDSLDSLVGTEIRSVDALYLATQNLAQKLVSRHEELTNTIARDLHDVVIAELMLLKRALGEEQLLARKDIAENLETLFTRLREICYDLAPRDLEDWGLQTVIEDLLERIGKRTGADFSFQYEGNVPRLERPVQLHIYRIVQECLNNTAKYADATYIEVRFVFNEGNLKVIVTDNGKGFTASSERTKGLYEGGMGMSSINERTEMIRCFHPAKLTINSDPGKGTVVTLEIQVSES